MSNASLANTGRPVSTKSRARDRPIRAGSRTVPPSINGTPETALRKCHKTVLYCMSKQVKKQHYLLHVKTSQKTTLFIACQNKSKSNIIYCMSKHDKKATLFTACQNSSQNYTSLRIITCHKTTLHCMPKNVTKLHFTAHYNLSQNYTSLHA